MANSHQPGKQPVNLSVPGMAGSKIRRDPPPALKVIDIRDRDERNRQAVLIGIVTFALALILIALGITSAIGWSPRQYNIHF